MMLTPSLSHLVYMTLGDSTLANAVSQIEASDAGELYNMTDLTANKVIGQVQAYSDQLHEAKY
jgi:hypothetical protein